MVLKLAECASDPHKEKLQGDWWYDEFGMIDMEFGKSDFLSSDKCTLTMYYTNQKRTEYRLDYEFDGTVLTLINKDVSVDFKLT